jgi:hypothetical protein
VVPRFFFDYPKNPKNPISIGDFVFFRFLTELTILSNHLKREKRYVNPNQRNEAYVYVEENLFHVTMNEFVAHTTKISLLYLKRTFRGTFLFIDVYIIFWSVPLQ